MKGLSLCRQINIEDIAELTPRKGVVIKKVNLNKPPQLDEVDERISQLVDILSDLQGSLDQLEHEYFQDITDEGSVAAEAQPDEDWNELHVEYHAEIDEKEDEYENLLQTFLPETTTQ
jgi:hypothetical protein